MSWTYRCAAIVCLACALGGRSARGQADAPATQPTNGVTLDLPTEGVELRVLADIVSKRLKIPIIYDDTILNKKVIVRVPNEVPESALLGVLESALRMKQMALVDGQQPGWKQIVPAPNLPPAKAAVPLEMQFVPLKRADPQQVVQLATTVLANRDTFQFGGTVQSGVSLAADERGGQVVVIAPKERMQEVIDLVKGMDKPAETTTKVYRPKHVSPERVDRLVKSLVSPADAKRKYQATADAEGNTLVVSATPEIHGQIEAILKELDKPATESQSPIRFYKIKNTKAADLLATINALYSEQGPDGFKKEEGAQGGNGEGRARTMQPAATTTPPERAPAEGAIPERTAPGIVTKDESSSTLGGAAGSRYPPEASRALGTASPGRPEGTLTSVRSANATVTADVNTNTIIVIAPPAVQQVYEALIRRVDTRRPQVQVECTIVTLDTTNGFSFGIDIGHEGGFGANNKLISFSSFGVSTVDPRTGGLTPTAGRGGTFALLSPGIADVVLRALSNNARSRLVAAPQLLVNDNGRGKLQSVVQEPYAEILDTATTQSRTGLGGLAQAGTTISVEPHISEDDYLQLAYSIELSSFTGQGRSGLPPPSQKNTVDSTVTIPDGYTIVVGGLSTRTFRKEEDSIPGIDRVPVLRDLFGNKTQTSRESTLFVFMRPVILRDDKFEDLKYLSERAGKAAGLPGDFPESGPIPMR